MQGNIAPTLTLGCSSYPVNESLEWGRITIYNLYMPHIHTQPGQHDLTVSAYIIRTDGKQPRAMMHVHRKLGLILQFGGHVELDETPWQAILHELVEETGYQPEQLQLLQPKNRLTMSDPNSNTVVHPYPVTVQTHPFGDKPHRHTDISYAFVTSEEPRNAPHEGEATNFIFFTAEELATSTDPKLLQDNRDIFGFVFQHCLPEWERVALSEFRTT